MAKPINPYQGPAPAAMAQMGAGILEAGVAAGANVARTLQGGYESLGKGIASGITAAGEAYKQYKDDQAKFDATKKMVKAFEGYLPKQKDPVTGKEFSPMADQLNGILNDTTISTREKVAMTPLVMNFLGQAQQQYGKERVAGIMTDSREAIAANKPQPKSMPAYGVGNPMDRFNQPVGGQAPPKAQPNYSDLPRNPSQGDPSGLTGNRTSLNQMPLTRKNPQSGVPQFWDPVNKRYIDEELYFNPETLQVED